jgi:hypothetical protein
LAIWTGLLVWRIILLIFIIPTLALSAVNKEGNDTGESSGEATIPRRFCAAT